MEMIAERATRALSFAMILQICSLNKCIRLSVYGQNQWVIFVNVFIVIILIENAR